MIGLELVDDAGEIRVGRPRTRGVRAWPPMRKSFVESHAKCTGVKERFYFRIFPRKNGLQQRSKGEDSRRLPRVESCNSPSFDR